jgi:hypothetical protein
MRSLKLYSIGDIDPTPDDAPPGASGPGSPAIRLPRCAAVDPRVPFTGGRCAWLPGHVHPQHVAVGASGRITSTWVVAGRELDVVTALGINPRTVAVAVAGEPRFLVRKALGLFYVYDMNVGTRGAPVTDGFTTESEAQDTANRCTAAAL